MNVDEALDLAALFSQLQEEGYTNLELKEDRVCGLLRFAFTYGLMVGLDRDGYERRYCYEHEDDALAALKDWDGKGHPKGPWIKLKGTYQGERIDLLNPELT